MITSCTCGSKTFYVTESLLWGATLEDNKLDCKNKDCEIREIACKECMKEYKEEEFDNVEINFD